MAVGCTSTNFSHETQAIPLQYKRELLSRIAKIFDLTINFSEQTLNEIQQACFDVAVRAYQQGDWQKIDESHREGKITDLFGRTLLMHAVSREERESTAMLIHHQICIHEKDHEGNTALHHAAKSGAFLFIPQLLEHFVIDEMNKQGVTPLHLAIQEGHPDVADLLVSNGARLDLPVALEKDFKLTALPFAMRHGQLECVKILMASRCDFKEDIPHLGNLLHVAVHFHQPEILYYLLHNHFTVIRELINKENSYGLTPMNLAAALGEEEAIAYLFEAGASLESLDPHKRGPLHHAALAKEYRALILLVKLGSQINVPDKEGNLPIHLVDRSTSEGKSAYHFLLNILNKGNTIGNVPATFALHPPENLTIQGGGARGIVYGGAIRALEQANVLSGIKRVAGTSAGAITAALLAVGYTSDELDRLLDMNFMTFLDHPLFLDQEMMALLDHVNITQKIPKISEIGASHVVRAFRALWDYRHEIAILYQKRHLIEETLNKVWGEAGVCDGETFRKWIEEKIKFKTGIDYCTFGELQTLVRPGSCFRHLHVYGTGVNTREILCLHSEIFEHDHMFRNVIVSDAVRISMSIPGVYKPHNVYLKINGERVAWKELGTFCDGGLLYNSPEETFDKRKFVSAVKLPKEIGEEHVFNKRTICLQLYSSTETPAIPEITGEMKAIDLLTGIANAFYNAEARVRDLRGDSSRVVKIDTGNVGMLDFDLKPPEKEALDTSGFKAIRQFLDKRQLQQTSIFDSIPRTLKHAKKQLSLPAPLNSFVGRKGLFENVKKKFLSKGWIPSQQTAVVLLHGAPGMGKSEFAIAFGDRFLQNFSLVWLISMTSPAIYEADYRRLAKALNIYLEEDSLKNIIERVHSKLSKSNFDKPWLLIFDNVDRPVPFPTRGGCVLATSQHKYLWRNLDQDAIPVLPFTEKESLELLSRSVPKEKLSGWKQLVHTFGNTPFLVDLSRAYISSTHSSVEEYLGSIEGGEHPAFIRGERYPRSLAQSYTLTLNLLREKNEVAWKFLQICVYLNPARIDRLLLEFWLTKRFQITDVKRMRDEIIRDLENLSLIRYNDKEDFFSLHGYLRFIVDASPEERRKEVRNEAALLIGTQFEQFNIDSPETWKIAEMCSHHADWLIGHSNKKDIKDEILWIVSKAYGLYLRQFRGDIRKALPILQNALRLAERIHHNQLHSDIAWALNNLGRALEFLRNHEQAIKCHERALEICLNVYDESHPDTAWSLNNLGVVWRSQGKYRKVMENHQTALNYHLRALKMYQEIFREKPHPHVALSLSNLGLVYRSLNEGKKAVECHVKALKMYRQSFQTENHPYIALSLNHLGTDLMDVGRKREAIMNYKKALNIYRQIYENKPHPHIYTLLKKLGSASLALKEYQQAMRYFEQALEMCREIFSDPFHQDVPSLLNHLGKALLYAGSRQEAANRFKEAYSVSLSLVGKNHPQVKEIEQNLNIARSCLRSLMARM